MLEAVGLHKRYGDVAALDGFDLRITAGEIVGLIGRNGAGKSTFAAAVAGAIRPDRGVVRVAGVDVHAQLRRTRHRVGLAAQELEVYPTATVVENLRFFGGLYGLRAGRLVREIDQVTVALGLGDMVGRRVGTLSGGQQRRVHAAVALLHRPDVLLLDEPTVGADPASRTALLSAVRERAEDGAAVCYTTHYLPELVELDAAVAVVAAGRVVARGDRRALLAGIRLDPGRPGHSPDLDDLFVHWTGARAEPDHAR
jgi:ABC-2 type transport system ATP-binding protein